MPVGLTQATVVNAALQQIAAQTRITSLADGSPAANQAQVVYAPTVNLLLRELDPDFARLTAALTTFAGTPPLGWQYMYTYPADCLRLRQVAPPATGPGALVDPFDPQPIRYNVAQSGTQEIIATNQQNAVAVYTTSTVTEDDWDAIFADAVIRRLANPLGMAASGRPDWAKELLQQAAAMAQMAEGSDEGAIVGR